MWKGRVFNDSVMGKDGWLLFCIIINEFNCMGDVMFICNGDFN